MSKHVLLPFQVMQLLPGAQFDIAQTVDANGMPLERPFKLAAAGPSSAALGSARASNSGLAVPSSGGGGAGTESSSLSGLLPEAVSEGTAVGSLSGGDSQIGQPLLQHEVVLVVFIGGVTFSEISALRYLASRPGSHQR